MPRDACCWRRRARTEPDSPVYTKEALLVQPAQEGQQEKLEPKKDEEDVKENELDEQGNPRNKCALGPGHSLMDWIRLGQSGRDLTGLGRRAGTLSVSPKQLAEHTSPSDAWLAIRGKVYNVSAYLAFHPGGKEELMKGVGKDATDIFNEVHAWVNYESILQKCLVGRLTSVEPDVDTAALFYGTATPGATSPSVVSSSMTSTATGTTTTSTSVASRNTTTASSRTTTISVTSAPAGVTNVNGACTTDASGVPPPRFDWIQKMDYITTIFYTKAYCNPQVQITAPTKQNEVTITLTHSNTICTNQLRFAYNIHWPCRVSINCETGKVEVKFRKILSKVWESYGSLTQSSSPAPGADEDANARVKYIVMNKVQVNHNSWMLALQRSDGVKQTVPIGRHVRVYGTWSGQDISRDYTPIPATFMSTHPTRHPTDSDHDAYTGDVCLLVKGYPQGMLSPWLCARAKGDSLELSRPLGNFDLRVLENRELVLLLAAGTGITPMLGVVMFLLERRQRRCQKVTLLFFNRKEEDILCREHLDKLQSEDSRLTVSYILSEPQATWSGHSGHVSSTLVRGAVANLVQDTHLLPTDVFACVCGPTVFTNLARSLLGDMGYRPEHMHCFLG